MTSYTTNLTLPNPTPGDPSTLGTWGTTENTGRTLTDDAVAGILSLSIAGSGVTVLTTLSGAADQARHAHFVFTGVLTGTSTVLWPQGLSRMFSVANNTTGAFSLLLGANNGSGAAGGTTVTIPQGVVMLLVSNGTNVTSRQVGFSTNQAMNNNKFTGLGDGSGVGQAIVYGQSNSAVILNSFTASDFLANGINPNYESTGFGLKIDLNYSGLVATDGGFGSSISCVANSGGVILTQGATSWASISQRAAKKNLEDIKGDPLDIIAAHEVKMGHYVEDADDAPLRPFLFYEDAIQHFPEATVTIPEQTRTDETTGETKTFPEFKGIMMEKYIPLLMAAFQKQIEINANLEARIAALEGNK